MTKLGFCLAMVCIGVFSAAALPGYASLPLETETARLPPARQFELETVFEYQTAPTGTEMAVPFALEYGLTDRWSVLLEPVLFTRIQPKTGRRAQGLGDLEITLFHSVAAERRSFPALAVAGEVKVPTAGSRLIGTGKTDFTLYLIASKRFGRYETHVNLGYTFVGQPAGVSLNNIYNLSVAEEYHFCPKLDLVGEILANTSSAPGGGEGGGAGDVAPITGVAPEAAAGEVVGLLGFRYALHPDRVLSLGVTYDNNSALLIRTGLTLRF